MSREGRTFEKVRDPRGDQLSRDYLHTFSVITLVTNRHRRKVLNSISLPHLQAADTRRLRGTSMTRERRDERQEKVSPKCHAAGVMSIRLVAHAEQWDNPDVQQRPITDEEISEAKSMFAFAFSAPLIVTALFLLVVGIVI